MKAKKENKVYTINTEQEAQRYLNDGYDIYDDDGNVRDYSPKKKIAFSEYMKAVKEVERLQALATEKDAENETLKAEIAALQQPPVKKVESKKAGE